MNDDPAAPLREPLRLTPVPMPALPAVDHAPVRDEPVMAIPPAPQSAPVISDVIIVFNGTAFYCDLHGSIGREVEEDES